MTPRPTIALLTDFSMADWFVGSMKAVILSHLPDCAIVDLCHTIEPGNVAQGAWLLARTFRDFPPGAVFCAVVDPGVGAERRALVASGGGYFFVAPDNGLLTGVRRRVEDWECRAITNKGWMRPTISHTFHGRDVFAPAAALIAIQGAMENAGPLISDPLEIDLPHTLAKNDGSCEGTIVLFDRFGNAVTSIEQAIVCRADENTLWEIDAGHLTIVRISSTFADVASNEVVAYWGSLGTLEIAVRDANARELLGLQLGQKVLLSPV